MTVQIDPVSSTRIFACTQCPKMFATRSNLKRHMENPNIHNIPYVRSRDQKRWKGHAKKVVSKEETTERMRKWRAENREKNRQNDLRCRVYRLARQKFGEHDSSEKQQFVRDEIARRLGRRMMLEQHKNEISDDSSSGAYQGHPQHYQHQLVLPRRGRRMQQHHGTQAVVSDLPFYSAPQKKIELPSIDLRRPFFLRASSPDSCTSPALPHLSPSWRSERRVSSTASSVASSDSYKPPSPASTDDDDDAHAQAISADYTLPSMHSLLSFTPNSAASEHAPTAVRYVEQTRILDEFVGVVLNYAGHPGCER